MLLFLFLLTIASIASIASVTGYLYLDKMIVVGERQIVEGQRQLEKGQSAIEEGKAELEAGELELSRGREKLRLAKVARLACAIGGGVFALLTIVFGFFYWKHTKEKLAESNKLGMKSAL